MTLSASSGKSTLEELKQWSDEKILSFVQNTTRNGDDLHFAWNETVHPETLFIDFYDEVMVNTYTDKEKATLHKRFIDDGLAEESDDDGTALETLDSLLKEFDNLKEDAGEDAGFINPDYEPLLQMYMFKWMLASDQWGDEFLLSFVNDELDR